MNINYELILYAFLAGVFSKAYDDLNDNPDSYRILLGIQNDANDENDVNKSPFTKSRINEFLKVATTLAVATTFIYEPYFYFLLGGSFVMQRLFDQSEPYKEDYENILGYAYLIMLPVVLSRLDWKYLILNSIFIIGVAMLLGGECVITPEDFSWHKLGCRIFILVSCVTALITLLFTKTLEEYITPLMVTTIVCVLGHMLVSVYYQYTMLTHNS
jgi:nitrogen fixation-related uncharacterized protein